MIEKNRNYQLHSGTKVSVIDVVSDQVTYEIHGVRTLLPLRMALPEFAIMLGIVEDSGEMDKAKGSR